MPTKNRQIALAARPKGFPKESDFALIESSVPEPADGEFLVRILYLSVDPYMRGRMNESRSSYVPPFEIGQAITGGAVGEVTESRHPGFAAGDIVQGFFGWQEYTLSDGKGVFKVDPRSAPISTALGVLGMPGLTAYFGLLDIGRPQPGETVVVSGAAGAVGSLAGQIAKIRGCRVIGIAGSDAKVDHLVEELGFDGAFNYKTAGDYTAALRQLCPNGVDVYFDNVGGTITDAVLGLLNVRARVVVCGQISQYNLEEPEIGPRPLWVLIVKQARAEGFLVFQFAERYPEGVAQMAAWLEEGKLRYSENIIEGLENAPRAFIGMLQGENTGKQLVKVAS